MVLEAAGEPLRLAELPDPVAAEGQVLIRVQACGVCRTDLHLRDGELAALYRGARCVVLASLYEGFGIPVLEAMASGTPAVTSRGGATEEVAGGAAVLVDPPDSESIAAGIAEAQARRDELVPLGLARAREFTWDRAADGVEALWRELA